jgi:hypothetical protein
MDENKDMIYSNSDDAYRKALELRKEGKINDAIDLFETVSKEAKSWIINDYALCLIERNENNDLEKAEALLYGLCKSDNSQSIRLLGLIKTKMQEENQHCLGELLLRYSYSIGNDWAFYDLFHMMQKRNESSDKEYLFKIYNDGNTSIEIKIMIFEYLTVKKNNRFDLEKIETIYNSSVDNPGLHTSLLKILIKSKRAEYKDLILQDLDSSNPENLYEIAKMYRDGVIVAKSKSMYKKVCSKLPKDLQLELEDEK